MLPGATGFSGARPPFNRGPSPECPCTSRSPASASPPTYGGLREPLVGDRQHAEADDLLIRGGITVCVSGSYEPPGQLVPPSGPDMKQRLVRTFRLAQHGRIEQLRERELLRDLDGLRAQLRREIDQLVSVKSCRAYAGGFVGYGCVGDYHSPGTLLAGTGRSSIGHTG